LQSALGDVESDRGAKYAVELVKVQREFDCRFHDCRSLENDIKMSSMPFNIDVGSVRLDAKIECIELQNDLDLKAIFLSKTLVEFCKECLARTRFQNVLKIDLFVWKYLPLRTISF